ncbi:MAG: hypothetical protein ACRYFX_08400 [Janthinobacterium lividum]
MADEQAGTLAFLQNFYTDVTLYVPFEAHERQTAPAAALPTVAPAPIAVAVPPAAPIAPPVMALPAAGPGPGRLPSLAGLPATPVAAASTPAVVAATPPVAPPAPAPPAPAAAPVAPYLLTTFTTLGSHARGVVVLVRLPPEQFVKLPRNVFLNKLLQAIQLVMADVVLVNVEGVYPVALENLRKELAATHILAFGKNLLDVAVRTTQIYEPVQFLAVGLAYLAGADVEMVEYDVSLKKRLWGGLKAMFLG